MNDRLTAIAAKIEEALLASEPRPIAEAVLIVHLGDLDGNSLNSLRIPLGDMLLSQLPPRPFLMGARWRYEAGLFMAGVKSTLKAFSQRLDRGVIGADLDWELSENSMIRPK